MWPVGPLPLDEVSRSEVIRNLRFSTRPMRSDGPTNAGVWGGVCGPLSKMVARLLLPTLVVRGISRDGLFGSV